MKKLTAILLLLCMLGVLTACSAKKENTTPPTASRQETQPSAAPTDPPAQTTAAPTQAETPAPTEAPTTTEAPVTTEAPTTMEAPVTTEAPTTTEAPATTEAPEEIELGHGRIEGDAYINESLNLRITRPDGYIFYTEEQIALQYGLTAELFEDTSVAELIEENGSLIDMFMVDASGSNVNLTIQPMQAAMDFYSDAQMFDLMKDLYYQQFEASGVSIESYEVQKAELFGTEKDVLRMGMSYLGNAIVEYQFMLRESGWENYAVVTITQTSDGGDVQSMLDNFSRLH